MTFKRLIAVAAMVGALCGCEQPEPAPNSRYKVTLVIAGTKYFEWTSLGMVKADPIYGMGIRYNFVDSNTGGRVDIVGDRSVVITEQIVRAEK